MLEKLVAAHGAGRLQFLGSHAHLADAKMFAAFLAPLSKKRWFVYAKRPFAGPKAVLAYLSRYTHRVAISNSRLIAVELGNVTFKVKDYRIEGPGRYTTMTLDAGEFIRRFLIHVLPKGFHRIRHYGLFASANRAETSAVSSFRRGRRASPVATPFEREGLKIGFEIKLDRPEEALASFDRSTALRPEISWPASSGICQKKYADTAEMKATTRNAGGNTPALSSVTC